MKFDDHPFIAIWEMTQACDLVCQHCRAEAHPERHEGELSTTEAQQMLVHFAEVGVPLVILTGGDPAKRPDLLELVRYGSGLGLKMGLTPSATPLVTASLLGELKRAGLQRLAMSIDGLTSEVHDAFRGREGSFDVTLRILQEARSAGLTTQVNTTLHHRSIHALVEISSLMEGLGIALWSVFTMVPTGRATETMMPGADEIESAFSQLLSISKTAPFAIKTTAGPHYRRLALEEKKATGTGTVLGMRGRQAMWVNDGRGFLFVSHLGRVFPSGFLPVDCGSVRERNPIEIYRWHPTFRRLRDSDSLVGKCRACSFRKVCGGCRARALSMTGDVMGSDPLCTYLPPGYEGPTEVFRGRLSTHLPLLRVGSSSR